MSHPELTVSAVLADDLRDWLTSELRYPVLAINTADGPPNQSVMWFDLHPHRPDTIVMNTMVRRLKYRQLQADPRVSLLFEDGGKWVGLRGTVEMDADFDRASGHRGPRAAVRRRSGALCRPGAGDPQRPGGEGHPP